MDRVKGKVAMVTGGAGDLGAAAALLLAKEGAKVVITDIDEVKGTQVVERIRREGGNALFLKQGVTIPCLRRIELHDGRRTRDRRRVYGPVTYTDFFHMTAYRRV